jgi:hypothetical protein
LHEAPCGILFELDTLDLGCEALCHIGAQPDLVLGPKDQTIDVK